MDNQHHIDLTPTGLAGYMWNATIPKGLPGAVISVLDDRIIGGTYSSTRSQFMGSKH